MNPIPRAAVALRGSAPE